jgi:hypothetical protein
MEEQMAYRKFQVLIRTANGAKHLEVVAIDIDAAIADLAAAYEGIEVIQWMSL